MLQEKTRSFAPAGAPQPAPPPLSRKGHETLVLRLLRAHGPMTRGQLSALSGLSRTTLYDVVGALTQDGTVVASVPEVARRGRGRPAELLALNPETGNLLGIEFARRAVRVAAMDAAHEIIGAAEEPHGPGLPWPARVGFAWRLANVLTGGTLRPGALAGIGVGVVGPVGPPEPGALWTTWHTTVSELVRERFGTRAVIDNNTRLAALAETVWGAAKDGRNVLYLRLSYGVGGGLVIGGALHRGAHGLSGEFGHITVEPDGASCSCGGVGCLETVASVGAVLAAYRDAGGTAAGVPELVAAAQAGDPIARAVLARAGVHAGQVLADVCNAFGPDVIIVGGELVNAGPALVEPLEQRLNARLVRTSSLRLKVRTAGLGGAGAALGALALLQPSTAWSSSVKRIVVSPGTFTVGKR